MQKLRVVSRFALIVMSVTLFAVLCGCSLFDLNDGAENILGTGNTGGAANVAFNIVVPGHASSAPTIRASTAGARVRFRVTLLQPGNTTSPTITFLKTVEVQTDGSATTTFTGLPEGSAIGEITIEGGSIGGKSLFHGASDLFPGNNTLTVSPKGSLHESDILANAMLAIAADPALIAASRPNLVTNAANAAASLIAYPGEDVYARVLESITNSPTAFDTSRYTQIDISAPDGSIRASGMTSWVITPAAFWQETPLAGAGLLPVSVPRQGIGDYAIVTWENPTHSTRAISRFSTTGGTLLNYLQTSATGGFLPQDTQILPGDGSMVIAGVYNDRPALVRWSGKDNTDLTAGLTATGLTWNKVFEIAPVGAASATISYLDYDKAGTGKILCAIKDPSAGTRLFSIDPLTGVATEQQHSNNFGLWAQVGSGTVALGWDGLDAATSYNVYYATGTVMATETAPLISTTEKVMLFENLVNDQTYTFQIAAINSDDKAMAWSTTVAVTPLGAADPIIYSNWKLASDVFEIGSAELANVTIVSFDGQMLMLQINGTSPLKPGSIITGLYNGQPMCVKLPMLPPAPPGMAISVPVTGASMEDVFSECNYLFRGKMSQLPVMSERLLSPADPLYQTKISYLRRGGMRQSLRAGLTRPITADPAYGDLSLEMDNFEFDPDVVVAYETSFGSVQQFEIRVDGYASCDIYCKFVASTGVELPAIEGTLLPHQEIPFFVGPVPGTWGREVTASWKFSLQAEAEVKAGTKMRVDFRSGANYLKETSKWDGQLLWRIKNTPVFEAKLQGTFSNEAAIEMKNSLKVGGLAGPELTLKPYIKSEATVSTEKPCEVNAALTMGLQGELKAIVQAWSYNIGEWGSTFEPFGPWIIASHTLSANATPTLTVTGPYDLVNKLDVYWLDSMEVFPHVYTSTGADSIKLTMEDNKGMNKGLSKIEVSVDGNPAFLSFTLASDTHSETGITLTPFPLLATLTMSLPLTIDDNMLTGIDERFKKWYTPFRLAPGPHEFEFKVYDKCGDFSIASHAVWVAEEDDIWAVKNTAGTATWQIGVKGFEKGELPERTRKIEPVADGFSISPLKDGLIKHYDDDGKLILEGAFTNNVRSGIWKKYKDENDDWSSINSFLSQVEFESDGNPVGWLFSADWAADSSADSFKRIQSNPSGASQFAMKLADMGYLYQDFQICSFTTGIRTIGFEAATCSYDIETFIDGQRNGIATHSQYADYQATVITENGEYSGDLKTGRWVKKMFHNVTELYSTLENTFNAGILDGEISYVQADGTWSITGAYTQGVRSGTWTEHAVSGSAYDEQVAYQNNLPEGAYSLIYEDGRHVNGSYAGGQPIGTMNGQWSVRDAGGNWVGSLTPSLDPISTPEKLAAASSSPQADSDWIER